MSLNLVVLNKEILFFVLVERFEIKLFLQLVVVNNRIPVRILRVFELNSSFSDEEVPVYLLNQ